MQHEKAVVINLRLFFLAFSMSVSGFVYSSDGIRYFSDVNTFKTPPRFVEEIEEGGRIFEGFSYYSAVFFGGRVVEYHKCNKRKVLYWVRFFYDENGVVIKEIYYDLGGNRVVVDSYVRGKRDVRRVFPLSGFSGSHVLNACGASQVAR
jgi:hypothetical protein